ncbi:migration and invasion enhancer 1-like [Xenia sp. Carnegie-2017]|uniref:migration and invasion enhancer 1-like n=1 Tax=Xenia sp. Carnegie-2017 TaxID=2897299 RepID=UPI001F04580B|nr:migration and invasion enhancer 1-like [Xenia sp. Carnegie-2017]
MPKPVNVVVEMSGEKAYKTLFAELSSWVRRRTPSAECTGKTGSDGAFEVFVDGQKIFSKLDSKGYPVLNDIAMVIEKYANGKPAVIVTKTTPKKCPRGNENCVCGISFSLKKTDCPCQCVKCY